MQQHRITVEEFHAFVGAVGLHQFDLELVNGVIYLHREPEPGVDYELRPSVEEYRMTVEEFRDFVDAVELDEVKLVNGIVYDLSP